MIESQYIIIGLILFGGSIVQTTSGFGFGMFSIPLILLTAGMTGAQAISEPQAIAIVSSCILFQTGYLLYRNHFHVAWREITPLIIFSLLMQPLGVFTLKFLTVEAPEQIKRIFGGIILAALILRAFVKPKPQPELPYKWGLLGFGLSGYFSGLAGMGGPPLVLWVMSHTWSVEKSRATLWASFLCTIPSGFFWYWYKFGNEIIHAVGMGIFFIPVALIATIPGVWIGNRMSKNTLSLTATMILLILSLYIIFFAS